MVQLGGHTRPLEYTAIPDSTEHVYPFPANCSAVPALFGQTTEVAHFTIERAA